MTVPPQKNGDAKVITDQVSTEVGDAILNNADNVVPQATQRLWNEVAHGIDKNSTVVWKNAVDSLAESLKYLLTSLEARTFVENYMRSVITILLEQIPQKIGQMEKQCVQDSLLQGLLICFEDLKCKRDPATGGDCMVLEVLSLIFNKKMQFYKGSKHNWNNNMNGLPEVRMRLIEKFRSMRGFHHLGAYLDARNANVDVAGVFPAYKTIKLFLEAACDAVPIEKVEDRAEMKEAYEDDILSVARAVMKNMELQSEEALKKISHDDLNTVRWALQNIYQNLIGCRRDETYKYYQFCRTFALKLITSQSLPLKLYGWETVTELVDISQDFAPPPRSYIATGAGTEFVNGTYNYSAKIGKDGFTQSKVDHEYKRIIPASNANEKAKTLTLFKCTMRSQQKWWFISEADENSPGTDKDIDYYQQKSKKNEEIVPPSTGWMTCRNAGTDPAPYLEPKGIMVPLGEEYNTLEHQMAKWAIDNKVVELVLGNSIHREIVARSVRLINFLVSMCTKDELLDDTPETANLVPNQFCLNSAHLQLAWKTCASKLDAAVSAEVYQLLVTVLPSLPNDLAVDLLDTIRKSCSDSLFEVAEFCSTLATNGEDDTVYFSNEVRSVLLELLWAVLTHPDASSLKCYDEIKFFMTQELRAEQTGMAERKKFLDACKRALKDNSISNVCDEAAALRMVRLTRFILQACPREQATKLITEDERELANLAFDELIAYLKRRDKKDAQSIKKASSTVSEEFHHSFALGRRLDFLRFVFGISETIEITTSQLDIMWGLCSDTEDREAIMIFLAHSGHNEASPVSRNTTTNNPSASKHQALTAAYSDQVRIYAFKTLFCSQSVQWEHLGKNAYHSFQEVFKSLKKSVRASLTASGPALDALWKICLEARDNHVASQAMRDLLAVYSTMSETKRQNEVAEANAWTKKNVIPEVALDPKESFSHKIFDCLTKVTKGLQRGDSLSVRSAERCIQILNAAVGDNSNTPSVSVSPSTKKSIDSIAALISNIQHGYRGQGCYRTISALAKRTGPQQQTRSQNRPQTERFSIQIHPLETLKSLKFKVALVCDHAVDLVKPISLDNNRRNLNVEQESSIVGELGISEGSEIVFLLGCNPFPESKTVQNKRQVENRSGLRSDEIFGGTGQGPTDEFFNALLNVLEALSLVEHQNTNTESLVWDLLQSVPSNAGIVRNVRDISQVSSLPSTSEPETSTDTNSMTIDVENRSNEWSQLLNPDHYARSVYVLQIIESFLQPATEVLNEENNLDLCKLLVQDAASFRQGFIESGGFNALIKFFTRRKVYDARGSEFRMENACVFRIFKACFYGRSSVFTIGHGKVLPPAKMDNTGATLMQSLQGVNTFLMNLTEAIVLDTKISSEAVMDVLMIVQSTLLSDPSKTQIFAKLPNGLAEKFTINLLTWDDKEVLNASAVMSSLRIRKTTEDFILETPLLSQFALPWIIEALDHLPIAASTTKEFFAVSIRLVAQLQGTRSPTSSSHLQLLSDSVCKKLAFFYENIDQANNNGSLTTGVLCGCLQLLRSLIDSAHGVLDSGVALLLKTIQSTPWAQVSSQKMKPSVVTLINLMGVIFDCFLSAGIASSSSKSICNDAGSCKLAFDVLHSCAKACESGEGYLNLSLRVKSITNKVAPSLRHKWGQGGIRLDEAFSGGTAINAKYSGLKNQGCTCYMNSVLQQLFMMPELRMNISNATLPSSLRSTCTSSKTKGTDIVGKHISVQWENGTYYDANVLSYDGATGMHTISYQPVRVPTENDTHEAPTTGLIELPEEYVLSEGRSGKETGLFDVVNETSQQSGNVEKVTSNKPEETEDEISYRRLLEEVQRTFVHLDEGSRGRVFDPKSLVESSACLKLEFDIWQQNDASEFAMKLLDKLEVPLKKWSPNQFKFLEHTFRLKQAKQKICKECGLKTNREENLMNIDCQIRGKSDIHEALSTMCEVEYMEGDNKVFCEKCKKNCDTVLRTAISALPDMLILSLKRFDLDYNTFETVKLNSRCEFGQTLNMKRYTLEGVDAMEKANGSTNESDSNADPLSHLPDEDYEYRLAGVLVHHGVAQGGHYYSFIRDRTEMMQEKNEWHRFDDEDVTPFDPSNIETECFGGKVKKETKWPNGQVNTVETEQLANALMLFYEKVKPVKVTEGNNDDTEMEDSDQSGMSNMEMMTGSEEFQADVKRSNTVHRSHSFLYGKEFQSFMKHLLDQCVKDLSPIIDENMAVETSTSSTWTLAILDACLCFFFDVLLHLVEKDILFEWRKSLCEALRLSPKGSVMFVSELSKRTKLTSANWLRKFATDCSDILSREAAMEVFATAIESSASHEGELNALKAWTSAWQKQVDTWKSNGTNASLAMPSSLQGELSQLEDVGSPTTKVVSNLGTIISFLCVLLEAAPRTWRYTPELCLLIRNIASVLSESGGDHLRNALLVTQIPARLICTVLREKTHPLLRSAFPGACLSADLVEQTSKSVFAPSSHILNSNSVGMNSNMNSSGPSSGAPSPADHSKAIEALAAIICVKGMNAVPLVCETGRFVKNRPLVDLTPVAKRVLSALFEENSSQPGAMNQKDVFYFVRFCSGGDAPQQRIANLLNKYGKDSNCLTLEGFLAHYRDASQSSEHEVRSDLHAFGFRSDLSRCPDEARIYKNGDQICYYTETERVVNDAIIMAKENNGAPMGQLAAIGLSSLELYHIATFSNSCHLAEYIMAFTAFHQRNSPSLIVSEALKSLYHAQGGWSGNEVVQIVQMALKIVAAIPGNTQKDRINNIMQSNDRISQNKNIGGGLLVVAKDLAMTRSHQQYNNDYSHDSVLLEIYIEAINELKKVRAVDDWMAANKEAWSWLDQWLRPDSGNCSDRSDRSRRDGAVRQSGFDQTHSDSDLNGINESDDEDDDSRFEAMDSYNTSPNGVLQVQGAGITQVNGIYTQSSTWDNVALYTKEGIWEGANEVFSLFRCRLSDNSKRWYISIIPRNNNPGTSKDIDFYMSSADGALREVPHNYMWLSARGKDSDPPPSVVWKQEIGLSDNEEDPAGDIVAIEQ